MDLKTIQQLQTDLNELCKLLDLTFVTPSVEIDETQLVKVELKVSEEGGENHLGKLIGNRGESLLALEFVLALMVNRGREEWLTVKLDVDGYRHRREDELKQLALKMADKVKFLHETVELRPMNNADRKVIHMVLTDMEGVTTESVGEGRDRRVVIKPQ